MPLRDPSLGPAEILMSESQERMMAVTEPGSVAEFMRICARWDVPATVIGEVTETGRLVMTWHGAAVVDIPPGTAADEGPVYDRPAQRPASQDALVADDPAALPRPAAGAGLRATLLAVLGSPDLAAKTWVTEQYDTYVRGNTVLAMLDDAGVLRIDEDSGLGSRSPPTATGGTRCWTRTPVPSSRSPRPAGTSPPPARGRSPSPTASTSARPRSPR